MQSYVTGFITDTCPTRVYIVVYDIVILIVTLFGRLGERCLTGPHAFGPKNIYFRHKILMKQPHDCSY